MCKTKYIFIETQIFIVNARINQFIFLFLSLRNDRNTMDARDRIVSFYTSFRTNFKEESSFPESNLNKHPLQQDLGGSMLITLLL